MRYFLVLLFLVALFLPSVSHAVLCNGVENNLNLCYPEFGGIRLTLGSGLGAISWLYAAIIGLSGLAAFIMLVWAGFQWLSSAGNPSQVEDAKDKIRKALLGLLLVLSSFVLVQFLNPQLLSPSVPGLTAPVVESAPVGSAPPGQTAPGFYLCDEDNCSASGKFLHISDPSCTIDDLAAATTVVGPCAPPQPQEVGDTAWARRATAVRLNQVRGVAIYLWQKTAVDGFGRGVCFKEATTTQAFVSADRLDSFQIDTTPDTGWAGDPRSITFGAASPWNCTNPGITVASPLDYFFPGPAVFLFNKENFGGRNIDASRNITGANARLFGLPLERWRPGDEDHSGGRTDQYNEGRNRDIKSIWITEAEICLNINTGATEKCAVRFWDIGGWTPGGATANICFRESVRDLTEFSFDATGGTDMRDDIRGLQVMPAAWCGEPGVVLFPN